MNQNEPKRELYVFNILYMKYYRLNSTEIWSSLHGGKEFVYISKNQAKSNSPKIQYIYFIKLLMIFHFEILGHFGLFWVILANSVF